ncbi:MAG: rRNA maturation RNase YbeY [Gammaproteobacteria bacterium]|nr:rRNA maturation RNase YbeY [Gammaproteobacteria bacterium]MYC25068.1 rRNA maturation RNase YbeY [Gammaproteobacteria bacterium]
MNILLESTASVFVQFAETVSDISDREVTEWVDTARGDRTGDVCVRFMGLDEARMLNRKFRKIDKPTNVLAFQSDCQEILGDLAICVPLAQLEAREQGKALSSHLAHLVIHGTLHLCGLDHQTEQEAQRMESFEADLMQRLGFPNPYQDYG